MRFPSESAAFVLGLASLPEMTPEQRQRQRESFAYGKRQDRRPTVTRDPNPKAR